MKLKVGGDPEIFLKDTKTGMHVSAHDLVPGTKKEPHPLKCGSSIQHDGVALEINIKPAESGTEFASNIEAALAEAKTYLPDHIEYDFSPVVHFEKSVWEKIPGAARELGCDPDYSIARSGRNRQPRRSPYKPTMCTGSGHLTFGWRDSGNKYEIDHMEDCRLLLNRVENYFSQYRLLWDNDTERHDLYGAGGAYRYKDFGVEYRSLSNAWLRHKSLWPWLFDSCKYIFDHALSGQNLACVPYSEYRPFDYITHGHTKTGYYVNTYKYPHKQRLALLNPMIKTQYGGVDPPVYPADVPPIGLSFKKDDLYCNSRSYVPLRAEERDALWEKLNKEPDEVKITPIASYPWSGSSVRSGIVGKASIYLQDPFIPVDVEQPNPR